MKALICTAHTISFVGQFVSVSYLLIMFVFSTCKKATKSIIPTGMEILSINPKSYLSRPQCSTETNSSTSKSVIAKSRHGVGLDDQVPAHGLREDPLSTSPFKYLSNSANFMGKRFKLYNISKKIISTKTPWSCARPPLPEHSNLGTHSNILGMITKQNASQSANRETETKNNAPPDYISQTLYIRTIFRTIWDPRHG